MFFKKTTLVHLVENRPLLKKKDDDSKSLLEQLELATLSGLLGLSYCAMQGRKRVREGGCEDLGDDSMI